MVRSAGRVMVLFSGGVKQDDDAAVLRKVRLYMESGATGVMFGRIVAGRAQAGEEACPAGEGPLRLQDFRPRSMLHVKETRVATPRFPVIDVHTHFTFAKGGRKGAASEDAVTCPSTSTTRNTP